MNRRQVIMIRLLLNLVAIALQISEVLSTRIKNFRRWWVRPYLRNRRDVYGAFATLYVHFKLEDHEEFYDFVGMTPDQFDELFGMVRHRLIKHSLREPLNPELRLAAVLNFLRHGDSMKKTSWFFLIGRSTMYKILPEVCRAIYEELRGTYLSFPNVNDWQTISLEFERQWNFPHVLGTLDGKHIRLRKPPSSGSVFYCYKQYPSIVLMALSDAYKRFIWANIGEIGSANDAGIFQRSDLGRALEESRIQLPDARNLPRTELQFPYFIIGDGIFPLKSYLMKPYARINNIGIAEKIYNYRLSRARLTIECAFGILVKRWAILQRALSFKLDNIDILIMSLLCLHNFLITNELDFEEDDRRYHENIEENDDENEDDVGVYEEDEPNGNAIRMREALKHYFTSAYGQVHWQWAHI